MLDKAVEDAVVQENTDFFDAAFRVSDELKSATQDSTGYSLLHYAAKHSSERMVKYFLDKGFPLDGRASNNQTALHVAAAHCRRDVAMLLLQQQGCPVDARDSMGRTALHYCAMEMVEMRLIQAIPPELILPLFTINRRFHPYGQGGAVRVPTQQELPEQPLLRETPHSKNWEFVRQAGNFSSTDNRDIVSHLLHHGADVNASTRDEDTPLFQAIARGSKSLVQLFLERGANVEHRKKGYNALHHAATHSNKDIVEMLLDVGLGVNSVTELEGLTALHLAAASARSEEIVNLLIERGAMVKAKDYKGETPILMAVGDSIHYEDRSNFVNTINGVHRGTNVGCRQIMARLDDLVATANSCFVGRRAKEARYNEPQTIERRQRIIRSLLNAGAEVNHSSGAGEPAFHRALSTGIWSIIEPFLERGADVHSKNNFGWSALHIAVKHASVKIVETLIDRGARIDGRTSKGVTPLHLAVEFSREMHIELLLARGADIDATDFAGCTPLHHFVFASSRLSAIDRPIQKIVGILLDNGADPFARSIENKTVLDYTVMIRNDKLIGSLLRHLAYLEAMGDSRTTELATHLRGIDKDDEVDPKLLPIYEKYQREVVSAKEEIIYANVSYFDTITLDLTNWVKNDEFAEAFENNQTIKEFYFYEKVSKKFKDALNRKEATEYLAVLFSYAKLPISICEMILKYFEQEDIEKFVQSCEKTQL